MKSYISIKNAQYVNEYKIALIFNDGRKNIVDFKNFIFASQHPNIKKYRNIDVFKNFNLEYGDIEWNDYELSFPVNDLYRKEF